MKRLIFIIVFIFTVTLVYGQSAQRMKEIFYEGKKFYNQWELQAAAKIWEEGLNIAKSIGTKKGENVFLFHLGLVYWHLGDNSKAILFYEQSLEICRKIGYKKGIGNTLANLGLVYEKLGDYPKAISYYEQSLKINREIGDKSVISNNLGNLGNAYSNFGDYEKAISYCEQSLEIDKEIGDKKGISANLGNLGSIYIELSDYPKAISYYEQALEIFKQIGDKNGIRNSLLGLGRIYRKLSDYAKAISYCNQALEIAREIEVKYGIGANLSELGSVYSELGDYQKAISYYEQALEIGRKFGYKDGIAADFTNLGIVNWNLGNYQKAILYYEQSLKINREIGKKASIAGNLGHLGLVYENLGDYAKAIFYHEQALETRKEIGDKSGIGGDLYNLGLVYEKLGDHKKAISYYEQALEIMREIDEKKRIGMILTNFGTVFDALGDYPKALCFYKQTLKIFKEIGLSTGQIEIIMADLWLDMDKIELAEEAFLRLGQVIRLGRLNLVKQNYRKAIENYNQSFEDDLKNRDVDCLFADYVGRGKCYEGLRNLEQAKENYNSAIVMVENQREGLGEGEKFHFYVAEIMNFKRTEPYEGLVRVHSVNNNLPQALFYTENLKARLLAEAITRGHAEQKYSLPYEVVEQEQIFTTHIRGLKKQMEALYKNNAMATYYEKEKELRTVKAQQQQFITHLRKQYPEYASINYPQPIHANELILNANELLIEFEVTETTTHVFFLKDGELKTRTINVTRDSLEKLVVDYRGFFEGITKTTELGKYDPKRGKQLFDLLFGDALNSITEGTLLIIVPDEFLGILPFEALVVAIPNEEKYGESEFGPFPLGVTYLADKYLISYAPSATSLTLLRTLKKTTGGGNSMLVIADPIFSINDSRLKLLAQAKMGEEKMNLMGALVDWKQMGVKGLRLKDEQRDTPVDTNTLFPRLEKTEALAEVLQSLFSGKAVVFSGNEAREDKVRAANFRQYRYLTFATHGILDRTVPYIQEPALVLTQVGNPEGYDGFLTMSEVMGLKMDAEVVALTACETGLGKNVSGEGVMGMGRAFQYAGAQNVLVSLWSIAETSATELTAAFFRNIKEGHEPKEAIRLARNEIRHKGYEHPFYWASFILFGK